MADTSEGRASDSEDEAAGADATPTEGENTSVAEEGEEAVEAETAQDAEAVEERYDFEEFGPQDMAEMSYEEWDAAFDADTWITGERLLDRVEADLKSRVANRDVFAVVERVEQDGDPLLLAYSDEGYAVVYDDGSIEGSGTVLRDVKPSVALCSMDSYDPPEMPEGDVLPDPAEVPEGTGTLGNQLMQIIGAIHALAGVALLVAWIPFGLPIVAAVAGFGFLGFGVLVLLLVANARLSDRFRAEEYRNRLRAVGMDDEQPAFLNDEEGLPGELSTAGVEALTAEFEGVGDDPEDEAESERGPTDEAEAERSPAESERTSPESGDRNRGTAESGDPNRG